MLVHSRPEVARTLLELAEKDVLARWRLYEYLANLPVEEWMKEARYA